MERANKVRYTTYLPEDIVNEFKELSDKTGIPQAKLAEEAFRDFLQKSNGKYTFYQK